MSDSNNPSNKSDEDGSDEDIGNLIYNLSRTAAARAKSAASQPPNPPAAAAAAAGHSESEVAQLTARAKSAASQPPNPPAAAAAAAGHSESEVAQLTKLRSPSGPTAKTTVTSSRRTREISYADNLWLNRYAELVSYKISKGDCNVPGGSVLGSWVANQRAQRKQ